MFKTEVTEDKQITVYDAETHQPLTVTLNTLAVDNGTEMQRIEFITQDGQVAQLQPDIVQTGMPVDISKMNTPASVPVAVDSSICSQSQSQEAKVIQQQAQTAGQPASATNSSNTNDTNFITSAVPQMLFLNQVMVKGQVSFVLVDANNKPVQLPEGMQVLNLPSQSTGGPRVIEQSDTRDEPMYVNAKQYHRILKRRQARARLEAAGKIPKQRQKYLYESRHRHALNRVRSSGGVFRSHDDAHDIKPEQKVLVSEQTLASLTEATHDQTSFSQASPSWPLLNQQNKL